MIIKRILIVVGVLFFLSSNIAVVSAADVYNINCAGSCKEYPTKAAAASAATNMNCIYNLPKKMLPLKVIKGTCASVAPKDYHCICPLPTGCKDKLTKNQAEDLCLHDAGGICGNGASGPHYGTCPAKFVTKYKCVCPAGDSSDPTKKKCQSYKNNGTLPKTCSLTGIKGCEKIVPTLGECTTADNSGGGIISGSADLLLMGTEMNPAKFTSPENLLGKIIKLSLQAVGVITLGLYIYGGALYMVSGGNSEQQGKAIKILVWTTLGVVVISGSYMFVNYIFEKIIR